MDTDDKITNYTEAAGGNINTSIGLNFLAGDGEMSQLILKYDWSNKSI